MLYPLSKRAYIVLIISVLVGSCIAVLFVSLLYEGLKIFRARLIGMRKRVAKHGCW